MPPIPSARDLLAMVRREGRRRSDAKVATYRQHDGTRGQIIVRQECTDRETTVTGDPRATLRPGSRVMLVQPQGSQSKIAIMIPPPEGRGSSLVQADTAHVALGLLPEFDPAVVCPAALTGGEYLALTIGSGPAKLWASIYDEGAYFDEVGPPAGSAFPVISGNSATTYREPAIKIPGATAIALVTGVDNSQVARVRRWDYDADAWLDATIGGVTPRNTTAPLAHDGYLWFAVIYDAGSGAKLYLSRCDADDLSGWEVVGGNSLATQPTAASGGNWCLCRTASGFAMKCVISGTARIVEHDGTTGGAWSLSSTATITDAPSQSSGGFLSAVGSFYAATPVVKLIGSSDAQGRLLNFVDLAGVTTAFADHGALVCFRRGNPGSLVRLAADGAAMVAGVGAECDTSLLYSELETNPNGDPSWLMTTE